MRLKLTILALVASLSVGCWLASLAQAQQHHAPRVKLGQYWRTLRDAMDRTFEQLQQADGVTPTEIVDDGIYLRRIYLDLTGAPPSPAEIEAFNPGGKDRAGRTGQKKREAIVETLLDSPASHEHLAQWWTTVLISRNEPNFGRSGRYTLQPYLTESFKKNTPFDTLVRGLFGAAGSKDGTPYWGYFQEMMATQDLGYVSGHTSRVFLGRQVQCAECHDHHLGDWKQDDFEAWQAFFKSFIASRDVMGETWLYLQPDLKFRSLKDVETALKLKGKYKLPRYLDGTDWKPRAGKTIREDLADWMTSKDNPWFREMTVNRWLQYFLGFGIVNPVDDFTSINDPNIPVILRVMGEDFAASGFDTRYLIQAITTSRLYQRKAAPNPTGSQDRIYYSRQQVRALTPEMLARSIVKVLNLEELNPKSRGSSSKQALRRGVQLATRADDISVETYKVRLAAMLHEAFDGVQVIKEVDDRGGGMMQALMFMNAEILPRNLEYSLTSILKRHKRDDARIEQIYMTVLGRKPDADELRTVQAEVKRWAGPTTAWEDLFLALMCTTEFSNRN